MVPADIDVLFIAGFGPIVTDVSASAALYRDALGLKLEGMPGNEDYIHGDVEGVKHFALWPLSQAAQFCFGTDAWPADRPVPQAWLEFDVTDIAKATAALKAKGYDLLVNAREEPWGQVVTRMLSPEGLLVGVTVTPWMRKD